MIYDNPKQKKKFDWHNHLSTIFGAIVAIANAWMNVDFSTFDLDAKHILPLCISAVIALGGYMTSINKK
jgi:hypothetical protein